jgi:GTP-binding protein
MTMNLAHAIFEISAAHPRQFPGPDVPEIVFLGRSNVGKSSLLNTLTGRAQLARVSATPGKTQQINFFRIADAARFIDLPGYGFAKVSQSMRESWRTLIYAYFASERPIAMVLQLIDMRHPLQSNDAEILEWLVEGGFPVQIVMTKADKISQKDKAHNTRLITDAVRMCGCGADPLPFSAVKGTGKRELVSHILSSVESYRRIHVAASPTHPRTSI